MGNISNSPATGVKAKKKKKGFNFIDFLLILIALAVIGGVVYLFSPISFLRNMSSAKDGTLDYTIEIKDVDISFIENIKEGDVVIDSVSKSTIGTVTAVDHNTKHSELKYVENAEGQYDGVMVEYPDRYNLKVTVTAKAELIEGVGYNVNDRRIAIGEAMSLRFRDFVCEGYCIYVTPTQDFN